jgi:hypothetical protein
LVEVQSGEKQKLQGEAKNSGKAGALTVAPRKNKGK